MRLYSLHVLSTQSFLDMTEDPPNALSHGPGSSPGARPCWRPSYGWFATFGRIDPNDSVLFATGDACAALEHLKIGLARSLARASSLLSRLHQTFRGGHGWSLGTCIGHRRVVLIGGYGYLRAL